MELAGLEPGTPSFFPTGFPSTGRTRIAKLKPGGLENRFGPLGPTRVQIPPPPLDLAETSLTRWFLDSRHGPLIGSSKARDQPHRCENWRSCAGPMPVCRFLALA